MQRDVRLRLRLGLGRAATAQAVCAPPSEAPRGDPSAKLPALSSKLQAWAALVVFNKSILVAVVVVVVVLLPCCLGMAPLMFRLSSEFALSNWLVGSASRPARYIFALHFSLSCFFLPFTFPQTFGLSLWPFRLHCLCSSCHTRNAVVQLIFLSISPIYLCTLVPCATNTQYASFTPSFLALSLRHCSFPPACFVSLFAALTQLVADCPLPVCKLLSRQLPLACLPVASTHKFRIWFYCHDFNCSRSRSRSRNTRDFPIIMWRFLVNWIKVVAI